MKKKRLYAFFLALILCLNVAAGPVRAETEPSETGEPTVPETIALPGDISGDISITMGPHSIEGQVPLMDFTDYPVEAKAAMLYEVDTQTVMYGYNLDEKLYPASLTKVMTCLVALELCQDLQEVVTVPKEVMDRVDPNGSSMELVTDEEVTYDQLFYGLMVESANDAAMVLAHHLCGSEEAFVREMNRYARKLHCSNTNFANVHGLHNEDHYTTARDMVRILTAAIENEKFYHYFTTHYVILPATNKTPERELVTTNFMLNKEVTDLYYDTRVVGGKTGFTTPAGRCLVTLSESKGMRLISVVMGCGVKTDPNDIYTILSYGNFQETKNLINLAYRTYTSAQVLSPNQILGQFDVAYGSADAYGVVKGSVSSLVPQESDMSAVRYEYVLDEKTLTAPVEEGQPLGIVRVWYHTKCLAQQELYAASRVEKDIATQQGSAGTPGAAPVDDAPGIWNVVLIAILVVLGLIAAMLAAGYIRGAMIRAKRARRRKSRRRSR